MIESKVMKKSSQRVNSIVSRAFSYFGLIFLSLIWIIPILWIVLSAFRNEYKDIHNEFPFLGIQSYTGMGKTSLLNFLSRVCGYNWETIPGTCDSEYAFEV